jgi:hypothetical protein
MTEDDQTEEQPEPQCLVFGPIGVELWDGKTVLQGTPMWMPNDQPETIIYCMQAMEQRLACGYW